MADSVIGYRMIADGGEPSETKDLREMVRLLRRKLARHPAGRHYRVNGGPLRTKRGAVLHAKRKMRSSQVGDWTSVLVDLEAQHIYNIHKVREVVPETKGDKAVGWCEARLGAGYEWAGVYPPATDCSGMTMSATDFATGGKVKLAHNAAAQSQDSRMLDLPFNQLQRGDFMFFHGYQHVAYFYEWEDGKVGGNYWVIDEEPRAETSVNGDTIYAGLRIRPGFPRYYVGKENLDRCGRLKALNGPV